MAFLKLIFIKVGAGPQPTKVPELSEKEMGREQALYYFIIIILVVESFTILF